MALDELYAGAHQRVVDLLSGRTDAEWDLPVTATPGWAVRDILAHLAGVAHDFVTGNLEGAGSPGWTAAQVRAGRGVDPATLLAQWSDDAGVIIERLGAPGGPAPAAFDVMTHEHDLRGTFGITGPAAPDHVATVADAAAGAFGRRLRTAGLPAVRLTGDSGSWTCGDGEPAIGAGASDYEWFRALMGRRGAGQVRSYTWEGDPEPYLGLLSLFGALPDPGLAEPGAPPV
jgi:uncharacterized protein (TIGR03083 family)